LYVEKDLSNFRMQKITIKSQIVSKLKEGRPFCREVINLEKRLYEKSIYYRGSLNRPFFLSLYSQNHETISKVQKIYVLRDKQKCQSMQR
jgi:hypothetical protein